MYYFLLSSITFLQLYIPLAKYLNHLGRPVTFIKSSNLKDYANIYKKPNSKILNKTLSKNDFIKVVESNAELLSKVQIIFIVDGDIYGERKQFVKASSIEKINKNAKIISLQEHHNFRWSYSKFIDKVTYCVFPCESLAKYYNTLSPNNVYLGNTKFDDISTDKKYVYNKFSLNSNNKYCLLLYPREIFMKQLNIPFSKTKHLIEVLEKELGYTIIVKYRPKDTDGKDLSMYKTVISDVYPNESIELMTVCELCVMFSSSCIDECILTDTLCIDCVIDYKDCEKMNYLCDSRIVQRIHHWEKKSDQEIIDHHNRLIKDSNIFKEFRKEYLFDLNTSAKRIIDYIDK